MSWLVKNDRRFDDSDSEALRRSDFCEEYDDCELVDWDDDMLGFASLSICNAILIAGALSISGDAFARQSIRQATCEPSCYFGLISIRMHDCNIYIKPTTIQC